MLATLPGPTERVPQFHCRIAVLMLAGSVFAGCHWGRHEALAPGDFDRETTIPADIEAVWNAVIDVFGERDLAIDRMERASGFIGTDWMTSGWVTSAPHVGYLDCSGKMSFGKPVRPSAHEGRFNVVVRESDDEVVLKINSIWRAYRNAERVDCLSTGLIEEELHAEVRTRAASF